MTAEKIAKSLLEIKAVSLNPQDPYTWASGMRSPIYCDNRITMSHPKVRRQIASGLAERIQAQYPTVEVIAGTATAGIPHAAWVAEILDLPMIYIRGAAKDHGKQNQIEGSLKAGQKVVVIEDLISTGGSVLEACHAVEENDAEILGVAAIFSYQLPAGLANFKKEARQLVNLTNYSTLIQVAESIDYIDKEDVKLLQDWKKDPVNWYK